MARSGLSRWHQFTGILALIIAIVYGLQQFFAARRPPCYTIDVKHFGPLGAGITNEEDFSIHPFKVPFSRAQVEDLQSRLTKTRFYEPQMVDEGVTQSTYGFNRKTAESVRDYWMNTFDWKRVVAELNEFPQFTTNIAGLNIHFVRVTHTNQPHHKKEAILFLHGWPGSFVEYLDVVRTLNGSSSTMFDLIIPSLPGYGYSQATSRSGLNPQQMARIMHVLMQRLGHSSYVVVGGDWGSLIGTLMAKLYPGHVRGFLTTFTEASFTYWTGIRLALAQYVSKATLLDADEMEFLGPHWSPFDLFNILWYEGGYFHLQATKPDTIGFALNDSPMGLAAYILEKWSRWSNNQTVVDASPSAGLERFTLDKLLTNVMIYWTTGTITSSMRLYHEMMTSMVSGNDSKLLNGPLASSVPVCVTNYRHEINYSSRVLNRAKYPNIKLWLFHRNGGHFAAAEHPRLFARDIEKFLLTL